MNDASHDELFDVLVVGGGPVGGCAAALLQRAAPSSLRPLKVAVLESHRLAAPAPGEPLDSRVSALSRASERILSSAGAWDRIAGSRTQPYERMRIWHEPGAPGGRGADERGAGVRDAGAQGSGARGAEALVFDAADAGEPNLGIIAENRLVQAAVIDAFEAAGGRVIEGELAGLRIEERHVEAETSAGRLLARLVVGADGARSAVRGAVGLTADTSSYRQTAIVANVATEHSHERTAWQRFPGAGTLAFLPLADGSSSIVWSCDADAAVKRLTAPTAEFERELQRESDDALGAVRLVTERASFPLRRVVAHRYTAHRCALIGDAAHVIHPLAGQGVNLGLLDAASLAEVVAAARAEGEDPGAERILRRYERWRKSETLLMSAAIEAFDRFLAHGAGPLSRLARRGLAWVNRSEEIKRLFIARALGLTGELPQAARVS